MHSDIALDIAYYSEKIHICDQTALLLITFIMVTYTSPFEIIVQTLYNDIFLVACTDPLQDLNLDLQITGKDVTSAPAKMFCKLD